MKIEEVEEYVKVGIDKIGIYTPKYYMDIRTLAEYRGVDPDKWTIGIGQEKMAVATLASDVVAMAANAAQQILSEEDKQSIDQIIIGTESGVDFSKSIATFVHQLVGIQPFAKAFEIKQACYGATAAVQLASDYVRLRPDRKVLVIATDIARYGLETGGEVTQGAGAIAMLMSANPRILALEMDNFMHTNHQFDFWRPNYSEYALVDGQFSTQLYQQEFVTLLESIAQGDEQRLANLEAMVFHLPFTKMGRKALLNYSELTGNQAIVEKWLTHYEASIQLNKEIGNIYTGSLFLSLLSLLSMDSTLLPYQCIGLFSYGSGAVSELMIGELQPNYQEIIDVNAIQAHLDRRHGLSVSEYEDLFLRRLDLDKGNSQVIEADEAGIYFKGIVNHQRQYAIQD